MFAPALRLPMSESGVTHSHVWMCEANAGKEEGGRQRDAEEREGQKSTEEKKEEAEVAERSQREIKAADIEREGKKDCSGGRRVAVWLVDCATSQRPVRTPAQDPGIRNNWVGERSPRGAEAAGKAPLHSSRSSSS